MKKILFHAKRSMLFIPFFVMILFFQAFPVFSEWVVVDPHYSSPEWMLWDVHFTSSSEGWAVGYDVGAKGVILHYGNGSWTSVTPPNVGSEWLLSGIHLTSRNEGWAAGYLQDNKKGVLLHYANGSWTSVNPPYVSSDWHLIDLHFASSADGWAVGNDLLNKRGVFLHYANGFWSNTLPPAVSNEWYLMDVHLVSSSEGWAVGLDALSSNYQGLVFHYVNGSWGVASLPDISSSWILYSVYFTSSDEGWAAGTSLEGGVLLHYENGSWKAIAPPPVSTNWALYKIYFLTPNEGWAVGYDQENYRGVLLHYLNGSWSFVNPPGVSSDWGLMGVSFPSSNEGWAVGVDYKNQRGILLKYSSTPPETITTPASPGGPENGNVNASYTYSAVGSVSSNGDPIQYRFDWGDGTKATWLPVGQTTAKKSWTSPGTYTVKAQARCNKHPEIMSDWSEGISVDISGSYFPITPVSPVDHTTFDACSLYSIPTFEWKAEEVFKGYEIQFSALEDFSKVPVKVKATSTSIILPSTQWKKVMLLPGKSGGAVYWRIVGTRSDRTTALSEAVVMVVGPPRTVQDSTLFPPSKTGSPELNWQNACNVKFKVCFGNNPEFRKKTTLNYSIKNPADNGGMFQTTLTSRQWATIRKLIGDLTGGSLYWYAESWDGVGRYSKTDVMDFILTE